MQNKLTNLNDLITKFVNSNSASTSSSGTLPRNTIANPISDLKAITTRSGHGAPKHNPKSSITSPISEPVIAPVSVPKHNPKSSIPYPSRRNDERNCKNANNQIEKFYQIFKDMSFEISFAAALILMPKFASTHKALIENKEKLSEIARTLLNEHYSAVLLKKLPKKLGDPSKFLKPCDFPGMAECLALADLRASINLMPFFVWKILSLPDLNPTCMTLELANRSISYPVGVAEDVYVKVGSFHFLADFVVVDFDADPRVPLILRRPFLKIGRALIDAFEGELTLRVGKEAITFNLDHTSRYSANYSDMTAKRIDVIDMACEEYSQEVLGFSDVISSGNPTPYYDPIVSTTSSTLTPFENSDFLLEEVDAFLAIKDDHTSPEVDQSYLNPEGDILPLEAFLNDDPSLPLPNQGNYMPEVCKELKIYEAKSDKSSIDEPPEVKLKDLPPHLEYASWKVTKSYRGTHFYNDQFAKVMQKFSVTHRLATPYHPQTSGQVELSNRGLKRILERTVGDHRKVQINELKELRNQAYKNSLIYKEKTKRLHDSKIKDRVFNISDRVLLFNSRLKIFSGKLKSRWSGPFTISQVYQYGTIDLSQPDGPNFKVNGHRLKHYFGKDVPKLVVPNL
nr:reverse transcriptase domain-containing protein [Tanacetum cinerariifolium]